MSWGSSNTTGSVPTELVTMKTAGYSNTFSAATANGVRVLKGSAAQNKGFGQGWIHTKVGTGSVANLTITAAGTGYANTDKWSLTGGTVQANGTIVTNGSGVITGYTVTNAGAGFTAKTASATITTSAGTGATLTVNVGGRAGRLANETLITLN